MVLVTQFKIPYVRIQKIFSHQNNLGETLNWLLVKTFDWVDSKSPLDPRTCAPHITEREFTIIPISLVSNLVQDIQVPLQSQNPRGLTWKLFGIFKTI